MRIVSGCNLLALMAVYASGDTEYSHNGDRIQGYYICVIEFTAGDVTNDLELDLVGSDYSAGGSTWTSRVGTVCFL